MLLRPILRSTPCSPYTIGLSFSQTTQRTFATSSINFSPIRSHARISRVATAAPPSRPHPLLLTTFVAGSVTALLASRPITRNDTSPASDFSSSAYSHGKDAKVPLSKDGGRSINPRAIRQISMGSLMGLGLGVVVSAFSKMLVLVAGLGVVFWQVSKSKAGSVVHTNKHAFSLRPGEDTISSLSKEFRSMSRAST